MTRLARDPLRYLSELPTDAPLVRRVVGRRPLVIALAPEAAREALVTRQRELVKEQVIDAGPYRAAPVKPGLIASNQPARHEEGRRLLRPMFAREPTRQLVEPHVREWAGRLAGAWAQSGVVDVERELTAATMQIAAKSLFGVDIADREAAAADVRTVLGEFRLVTSPRTRAIDALRMRRGLRFVRAWERLAVVGGDLVAGPGPVAEALRGVELDDDVRLSEARNIVLAGTETTSTALTWALLELARRPSLADSLAEEGEPLAERVFAETLRLYPPAWYIARLAVTDVEVAGECIAEGTMALVSPYLLHRDARHYERPEQFDPERWRDGTAAAARAFTFLPFGAGTRRCIGEEIAWLEGRVILAELARSLVLEAVGDRIAPSPAASLRPASPVVVRVGQRP